MTLTNGGTISGGIGGVVSPARRRGRRGRVERRHDRDVDQQRHDHCGGRLAALKPAHGRYLQHRPLDRADTNSGEIIGNIDIENQASVTVTGGAGGTFGRGPGGRSISGTGT